MLGKFGSRLNLSHFAIVINATNVLFSVGCV